MKKMIVFTGGPASGKTTALSMLKEEYGTDIEIAKEAATLIYGGGFPRNDSNERTIYHAQRIIYFATKELEGLAQEINPTAKLVLCDRGSIDGAVYWPYGQKDFFKTLKTSIEEEYARYYAIIHMSLPREEKFYQNTNVRTETLARAIEVEEDILKLWKKHPRHIVIPANKIFVKKALMVSKVVDDIIKGVI